jgi:hypothetical protein
VTRESTAAPEATQRLWCRRWRRRAHAHARAAAHAHDPRVLARYSAQVARCVAAPWAPELAEQRLSAGASGTGGERRQQVVVVDNYRVLHSREAFGGNGARRLWRVWTWTTNSGGRPNGDAGCASLNAAGHPLRLGANRHCRSVCKVMQYNVTCTRSFSAIAVPIAKSIQL